MPICIDLTVVSSVNLEGKSLAQVFEDAEQVKYDKYIPSCNEIGVELVVVSLGSGGGFGKPALKLIDVLATLKEAQSKVPKSVSVYKFRAALSMAVVRAQANAWIQAGRRLEAIDPSNGLQFM